MINTISVIAVTFNAEASLEDTILSIINQSYQNIELIIIDGRSTDATTSIIEKYKNKIAFWVSEKDNGIYDAMNKGIAAATGDWVYFIGSDDILFNDRVLETIFTKKEYSEAAFIYGDTRLKSNNRILGGSRTYYELINQNISHQAIFYKRDLFEKVGVYNLSYKILADYDLNLRIFKDQHIQKEYLSVDVCLFNDKGGASNVTIDRAFFKDKLVHFRNVERLPPGDPALQQYYFYHGIAMLLHDKKVEGLSHCLRAFTSGKKKVFYMLVFIKFVLAQLGVGKKIKFA